MEVVNRYTRDYCICHTVIFADVVMKLYSFSLITASNLLQEAQALAQGRSDTHVVGLNVDDKESLGRLVSEADVVVRYT